MDGYGNSFKYGTVEGTADTLRVECGFVPKFVKIWNMDDAKHGTLEWLKGMGAGYGWKDLGDAYVDKITSGGITEFAGVAPGTVLSGTMTITDAAKTLAGASTHFLTELKVGSKVKIGDQIVEIATITNDTTATIKDNADGTETSKVGYDMTGWEEGFIIGTDTDINGSAETLLWMVMR